MNLARLFLPFANSVNLAMLMPCSLVCQKAVRVVRLTVLKPANPLTGVLGGRQAMPNLLVCDRHLDGPVHTQLLERLMEHKEHRKMLKSFKVQLPKMVFATAEEKRDSSSSSSSSSEDEDDTSQDDSSDSSSDVKVSRKKKQAAAPQCTGTSASTGHRCKRGTTHKSGACPDHRPGKKATKGKSNKKSSSKGKSNKK